MWGGRTLQRHHPATTTHALQKQKQLSCALIVFIIYHGEQMSIDAQDLQKEMKCNFFKTTSHTSNLFRLAFE